VLRGIGAGDIKLLAMVGTFLGVRSIVSVIILSFVIGGILSIFFSVKRKSGEKLAENIRISIEHIMFKVFFLKQLPTLSDIPNSVGKFPYATAIFMGTVTDFVLVRYTNFSDLF
jgi:prepilin peptidase CpaA